MNHCIADHAVKFRDPVLNSSVERRHIFTFFGYNCRPEVAGAVILGDIVEELDVDIRIKYGVYMSNSS